MSTLEERSHGDSGDLYPLSLEQEKLWLTEARGFGPEGHANVAAMRIVGSLATADLEQAVAFVLARHEALSIQVIEVAGRVHQVRGASPPHVQVEEVRSPSAKDAWYRALLRARAAADEPLDVRKSVCRARIVRVAEHDHLLVLVMHMLVSDGSSLNVLFGELAAALRAFRNGHVPELAPAGSPLQYACDQRARSAAAQDSVDYWVERVRGTGTVARLPYDGDPGDGTDVRGFVADCRLSADEARAVSRFAAQRRVTRFALTLASFALMLHALTGRRNVVVPAPVSTRDERTERVVGHFLNTVPYRLDLGDHRTFDNSVSAANAAIWDGWQHRLAPFQDVMAKLAPQVAAEISLRPNVMLAQNTAPLASMRVDDLTFVPIALPNRTSKFDLALIASETDDWSTRVTVRSVAFSAERVQRIAELYRSVLVGGTSAPERPAEELWSAAPLWSLHEPEQTFVSFPDALESAASRHPDAIALDDGAMALTYRELVARVRAADRRLRDAGIVPGDVVLLAADRVVLTYVAYLATLRAGAVVVPFDTRWPSARLASIVEDCAPAAVVAISDNSLPTVARFFRRDDLAATGPEEPLPHPVRRDDPAYVIFTSGTTGRPKGAILPHRALANLGGADRGAIGLRVGDRVAQFAPLVVDASVWDIVASLVAGATLVVVPDEVRADHERLSAFLDMRRISVVKAPPSTLVTICDTSAETLRAVISAGEPCPRALADRWRSSVEFFNAYGPTEAGCWATLERFDGTFREYVEIGPPLPGVSISVRTPTGRVVNDGCVGELWIAGEGVGLGYLRSDDLTRERFVTDAAGASYRSGDLGRRLEDGRFELLGRADRQVKLRGNRIQLEEIEHVLLEHPAVLRAAVLAAPERRPDRLIAFVELQDASGDDALIRQLRRTLPDVMLPARFVRVSRWPLSAGGKTDFDALRRSERDANERRAVETAGVHFYRVFWEPSGRSPDRVRSDVDVVVCENAGFGERVASALDGSAPDVIPLRDSRGAPHSADSLARWLLQLADGRRELRLAIVCIEPVALALLLPFSHAAVELAGRVRFDITLVTSGAFAVDPGDAICPKARAAAAFAKVLPQESTDVATRLLDLEAAGDTGTLASSIAEAVTAYGGSPPGTILAVRRGTAFRRRAVEVAADRDAPCVLRERGVYVLTGGFGGIARALALRLARDRQASLVLASRSAFMRRPEEPLPEDCDRGVALFIEQLESYGSDVLIVPCDAANGDDVDALVRAAHASFGRIHGVLHCAGVGSPASFPQLDPGTIERVMRPKDDGTRVLLERLPLGEMDFVASMSSTASFAGGFGSMAYTAANLVQEAHAERAAADIVTIAWGRWIESGMAARAQVPHDLSTALVEALTHGIDDEAGYLAFIAALGLGPGLVFATADGLPSYEPGETAAPLARSSRTAAVVRPRPRMDAPVCPPRSALDAWLLRRFEEVLSVEGIGVDDDLFVLGGHSLNAAQLATVLSEDFEVDVSLATIFRYPSVRALAELIASQAEDLQKLTAIAETYLYVSSLSVGGEGLPAPAAAAR